MQKGSISSISTNFMTKEVFLIVAYFTSEKVGTFLSWQRFVMTLTVTRLGRLIRDHFFFSNSFGRDRKNKLIDFLLIFINFD